MSQNRSFIGVFLLIVGALFLLSLAVYALSTQFSERQYRPALQTGHGENHGTDEPAGPTGILVAEVKEPAASIAAAAPAGVDGSGA